MKLEMTGRHVAVTPALKTFARTKLRKIDRLLDGPTQAHVILTVEKHRHIAEIVVTARSIKLSARESTQDMYSSMGECVDKLERQARKHKEKYEERRRRPAPAPADVDDNPAPNRKKTVKKKTSKKTAGASGTARRLRDNPDTGPDDAPRIVRTDIFPRKPMTVDEAALQVLDSDLGFLVFRNSRSQEINVLYRIGDGTLGLVEPED